MMVRMTSSVFDYRDYKIYLRDWIQNKGRGEKSRIAQALKCHLAYVSQVLHGTAQLSFEQADALNNHLLHTEDEGEFFLLLVSHARAGSVSLSRFYEKKIHHTLEQRIILENRLKTKRILPAESQAIYYSAWYYSAIHLLVSIPKYQDKESIATYLQLPLRQVTQVLDFLVSSGLAQFKQGRFQTGQVSLHLQNDSPWIAKHHSSWRVQSIRALDQSDAHSMHYTSVVSMSDEDMPIVRKILIEAIEKVRAIVRKSPEKALYCYTVDLFKV